MKQSVTCSHWFKSKWLAYKEWICSIIIASKSYFPQFLQLSELALHKLHHLLCPLFKIIIRGYRFFRAAYSYLLISKYIWTTTFFFPLEIPGVVCPEKLVGHLLGKIIAGSICTKISRKLIMIVLDSLWSPLSLFFAKSSFSLCILLQFEGI